MAVDSDAHAVEGLENLFYGVGVAQRAWTAPERVLNALSLDALLTRRKRHRHVT